MCLCNYWLYSCDLLSEYLKKTGSCNHSLYCLAAYVWQYEILFVEVVINMSTDCVWNTVCKLAVTKCDKGKLGLWPVNLMLSHCRHEWSVLQINITTYNNGA